MITVHHLEKSRSQRVLWLLEEIGLPYKIVVYHRDKKTHLAPPELKSIHPLGKSPVITDGKVTVAESGAILEYIAEKFGQDLTGDLAHLEPARGTAEYRQCRFWLHYAEGSLMSWLVMKLVFMTIPTQPMPFFVAPLVRPIAWQICKQVLAKLIDPNVTTAMDYMEEHLATRKWFAGNHLTLADFQMSFAIEAVLSRGVDSDRYPRLLAYQQRINARPAYQRAIAKGGPVVM